MFKCVKCGCCCRNLPTQCGIWRLGLFLLPNEAKLFANGDVAPMWGIGIKGNVRLRPAEIWTLQLKTKDCPHNGKNNLCHIYFKRPLVCKANPLSIQVDPATNIVEASVDTRCDAAKSVPRGVVNLGNYFSRDILRANVMVCSYLSQMFKAAAGRTIWLYDLKTEKWIQCTSINIMTMSEAYNLYERIAWQAKK